jgi:hypothetical protein
MKTKLPLHELSFSGKPFLAAKSSGKTRRPNFLDHILGKAFCKDPPLFFFRFYDPLQRIMAIVLRTGK